ncbi:uncharacterized protein [Phaseolus vulgaris]|uniref:uncharacterized protein n=1 Tax=Phaseolus vulgaris TaxID=3885 RepID=UPI0035CC2D27
MAVEVQEVDQTPDVNLVFTKADRQDVIPHDNDQMVISIVTKGRRVHRVLVDQGSSADVMFWSTFNKLQLSPEKLRPYTVCLYGFAEDHVEVRGHIELRTTFTDGTTTRTTNIRYLVVNVPSAYNILLGRPTLNRIGAVAFMRHMKMKLLSLEGPTCLQRRHKFNDERRQVVREETQKLLSTGHIREIQYPEWLANVVLVKKASGKWRMCVDIADLNKACLKDSYPLSSINVLVDSASGCRLLSFLDAFFGYNQIRMHPGTTARQRS